MQGASYCKCGAGPLDRDTVGINKKLLGRRVQRFMCIDCLAGELDVAPDELLELIEEFRDAGCSLFARG